MAVDTSALRYSRDYRLLVLGGFVSGLGTQVTLVALPFQVYVLTRSSLMVGLIGLAELIPLVCVRWSAARWPTGSTAAGCCSPRRWRCCRRRPRWRLGAVHGSPPVAVLFLLAGVAAGGSAIDRPSRAAILPNLVDHTRLRSAISFNYGLWQLTGRGRPGARRGDHRRVRTRLGVRDRRRHVRRHADLGLDDPPAAAAGAGGARAVLPLAGRRAALRLEQGGADGQLRDRHPGDDVRHAARAVPGALADRVPRRGRGRRPALRGRVGGRGGRRVHHRLAGHGRRLGRIVVFAVLVWGSASSSSA